MHAGNSGVRRLPCRDNLGEQFESTQRTGLAVGTHNDSSVINHAKVLVFALQQRGDS